MQFKYSNQDLSGLENILQRILESLPAAASWGILLVMFGLCFLNPLLAAGLAIAFSFYWLLRLVYLGIFLLLRLTRLKLEAKTDWLARARGLNRIYAYWRELNEREAALKGKQDLSLMMHKREVQILENSKQKAPQLDDLHHLIVIPLTAEGAESLGKTIASLISGNFPALKVMVVLAFAPGLSETVQSAAKRFIEQYREKFFDFLAVSCSRKDYAKEAFHGAMFSQAVQPAAGYFKAKQIPYEMVIVSSLEPGDIVNPDYLSCLTYRYMVSPARQKSCFQPIAIYDESVWQVSAFKRIFHAAASVLQIIEANSPDSLTHLSRYSLSLDTLVELNYWPPDLISADTAIFWKAFIYFNGRFRAKSLYVIYPLKLTPLQNQQGVVWEIFQEKLKLASAGENFSITVRALLRGWRIPLARRIGYTLKMFESLSLSSIWPFLVFGIAWPAALLSQREFSDAGVYYSVGRISFVIFTLMVLCLMMSIILTSLVLPKRNAKFNFAEYLGHFLALLFLTPVGIFLTAIATLAMQTKLMLGRRQ